MTTREDSDALPPQSPPVYRRMGSREDTSGDVFSRLGAGMQDPPPGGSIREFNGKVNKLMHTAIVQNLSTHGQIYWLIPIMHKGSE